MEKAKELPIYKCHKEVRAVKIREILPADCTCGPDGGCDGFAHGVILKPEDGDFLPILVPGSFMRRFPQPQAPGYYVVYEDGYASWSPVEAFEKGYTLKADV